MERSQRLYNEDLAPSTERKWGTYSITSVWFACLHNMGQYTMVVGMLIVGLAPWWVALGCLIGFFICYAGAQAAGIAGQKYGISYPVLARASFGVFGANLPAIIRGIVAIAWYGIQTYLASKAVIVLLLSVEPGWVSLTHGGFLGLSPLGWICFLALWLLQLLVVTHGMETVRKFQNWAGAAISLMMVVLGVALTMKAGFHLNFGFATKPMSTFDTVNGMLTDAAMFVATYATLMLNMCDFTRFSPDLKSVRRGNFLGLPVNGIVFLALVLVNTVAGVEVWGKMIQDPTDLLTATANRPLIIIGALVFVFATIGVNVIANIVSPAYDFANVFPRKLNFKRGALLACVLALLVMPWNFYNSPVAVTYFLGSLGAFLGPVFGVIMTDFYLNRKQKLDLAALYSDSPDAPYFYRRGVNPRALVAFVPAASISAVLALVPVFHVVSAYSWFVGVAVAGVIYRFSRPQPSTVVVPAQPAGALESAHATAEA
jgi:nucleobase:cation symporter-1, NCS1 family